MKPSDMAAIYFARESIESMRLVAYYDGLSLEELEADQELLLYDLTWECVKLWVTHGDPDALQKFKDRYKDQSVSVLFNSEDYKTLTSFYPSRGVIRLKGAQPGQKTLFSAEWEEWGVILHLKRPGLFAKDLNATWDSLNLALEKTDKTLSILQKLGTALAAGVAYGLGLFSSRVLDPSQRVPPPPQVERVLEENTNPKSPINPVTP